MTKTIAKLDFHYSRRESRRVGSGYGLDSAESTHSATSDEVNFRTLKSCVGASHVGIHMKDHEWCLGGEIINQFAGFGFSRIRKGATWAGSAHPLDVSIV